MAYPTNPIYKLTKDPITGDASPIVRKTENGIESFIPFEEANTDYQAYLLWVSEGNTADPAD